MREPLARLSSPAQGNSAWNPLFPWPRNNCETNRRAPVFDTADHALIGDVAAGAVGRRNSRNSWAGSGPYCRHRPLLYTLSTVLV